MPFGTKTCTKGKLTVRVVRDPPVTDGTNFKVKVRLTKIGDPNDGKVFGDSTKCETPLTVKKFPLGRYRVTVETNLDDGYHFDAADAVEVDVLAVTDPPATVSVTIRALAIARVAPDAAWRQYINLELTDEARTAGDVLVTHDVQAVRAAAALVQANGSGIQEWVDVATRMVNEAPGKAMDPKQLGRVLEVSATLARPVAGVKVYFGFEADGANPAWPDAKDELRAGLTHKPAGGKDKWLTKFGKKDFALTDGTGKATARLRLTRFGGDAFTVKASLRPAPLTNGKAHDSARITAWRKIWYQLTWNRDHAPLPLDLATADFETCFVEFEAIDPRPFTAANPIIENPMWQFDEGRRKGPLAPGQTARVEAIIDGAYAGVTPEAGEVIVTPDVGAVVRRDIVFRTPPRLQVTGADFAGAATSIGSTFSPLHAAFTVRNAGQRRLSYTVSKTQPWVRLTSTAGKLLAGASVTVRAEFDHERLRNLPIGTHTDTITFEHPGVGAETVTKTVSVTVRASKRGALVVTDHEGLTMVGPGGGPFTGATAKTWTLTNVGVKRLVFAAPAPGETWLKLACPEIAAVEEAAKEAKKKAEASEKKAAELEEEAKTLAEELSEAEKAEQKVIADADARVLEATTEATQLRQAATAQRLTATQVMARVITARQRAQAEQEDEDAVEAEERAEAAEETQRVETERATTEKQQAAQKTLEVRGRAEPKGVEATEARKVADADKKEADELKGLFDRKEARLEPGATASVTVTVKDDAPAVLGALPISSTVSFRNVTTSATVTRAVRVVRPGSLSIAEADLAKTRAAGDFDATSQVYTLRNPGDLPITFTAASDRPWITVNREAGEATGGAGELVTVTVNLAAANTFEVGAHAGTVTFVDTTNGVTIAKQVTLTVTANPAAVLAVTPWEETECTGTPGPPFTPTSKVYTLKNIGGAALSYEVSTTVQHLDWLRVSSPGNTIAIGDHNKQDLWPMRQQPANEHPRTVQLLICQKQTDPGDTDALGPLSTDSATLSLDGSGVVNADGDQIEVVNPSIDGQPVIIAGDWEWDGHTGTLVGHDDLLTVPRGRDNLSALTIAAPAVCGPDCAKAACPKGVAIAPTALLPFEVTGLELHGFQSYLGEGGYEDRPTCLIVAQLNQVSDFNDTVSHEIGHMMNAVLHTKAHQEQVIQERKAKLKQKKKDLKAAAPSTQAHANAQAWVNHLTPRIATDEKELAYFWPPGVPVHPIQYDGGQGNHCGEGGTFVNPKKYTDGTCVLFHAGRDVKLAWCANCATYFRFTDLRRFLFR